MVKRIDKVNELVKHELSRVLREQFNPENILVSVSYVKTSPDLKTAQAFLSIFPFERAEETLANLKENFSKIQLVFGESLDLKYIPKIELFIDESLQYGDEIEGLIKKIKDDKMKR